MLTAQFQNADNSAIISYAWMSYYNIRVENLDS